MKLTPQSKWISVFQSPHIHTIEIIKLKLEDEGIPVQVWNQIDSSYNAFGYIHLNVLREDEARAKAIIKAIE